MAKFLEFQGKEFFKKAGIPVPEGVAVKTPEEAIDAARKIGKPVVVKAQVHAGGRGKAGGVKLARRLKRPVKWPMKFWAWK